MSIFINSGPKISWKPILDPSDVGWSLYLMKGDFICAMVKSRYIGDGHPTFNRNPYNGYINPYYWVDYHPLLYGNNGSLDPGTFVDGQEYYWG